jgi:hypothetical protein
MRRRSGHRACQPHPVSGDEIASRARGSFAGRRGEPGVTGSIGPHAAVKRMPSDSYSNERSSRDVPDAVPGADGAD